MNFHSGAQCAARCAAHMNNAKSGANKYKKLLSATATEIWSTFSALYMAVDQLFWLNWHQVTLSESRRMKELFSWGLHLFGFFSNADLYQFRQEAHSHWSQFVSQMFSQTSMLSYVISCLIPVWKWHTNLNFQWQKSEIRPCYSSLQKIFKFLSCPAVCYCNSGSGHHILSF